MRADDEDLWFRGVDYLRFGYRVRPSPGTGKPRHFIGGKARHSGAVCRACDRPLLLLWDVDCTDPAFGRESRPIFGELERLPLYYCWTCSTWLAYQVTRRRVTIIAQDRGARFQDDWPYPNYPEELPRVPAVLEPIPADIEKICLVGDEFGDDWLTPADLKRFATWSGGPASSVNLNRQQFGGRPHLEQGHEEHWCPNKKCRWSKKYRNWSFGWMKELASVHNDPLNHLPLIQPAGTQRPNKWVQVVFWICPACLTVRADQRCD
jgi:hypothetical protein